MDDKRTLLAFLLVGLIFLLMPYYYELMGLTPPPQERVDDEVVETPRDVDFPSPRRSAARDAALAVPGSSAAALPSPAAALEGGAVLGTHPPAREVVIENDRLRLVFSSRGGVLVRAELLEYHRPDGLVVDLIPAGGQGLGLTLRSDAGDWEENLRGLYFEPNLEHVRVPDGGEAALMLRGILDDGRIVEKMVVVRDGEYGFDLRHRFRGFDEDTFAYVTWEGGIALCEREPKLDLQVMRVMAYFNDSLTEVKIDDDESDEVVERGELEWAAVRNKYFVAAVAPEKGRYRIELSAQPLVEAPYRRYEFGVGRRIGGGEQNWDALVYLGPLDLEEIERYDVNLIRALDLGFPVVRQIAEVLLTLFVAVHRWVPNYGWVIVLFGVFVKLLLYPLTHKSYESAARMQAVQPKLTALREKFKGDNQRLSQETMKLYKAEGVNPIGGCLPMLLQMPIMFALYRVFSSTIELRQAEWILWIHDLSLPDEIMVAGFGLHVLPLLMAAAMFFQSRMTMKDPKQAALVYVMPVVMVFMMWDFSSGLVLYWTVFNVLQIGQQYLTNHLREKKEAVVVPVRR